MSDEMLECSKWNPEQSSLPRQQFSWLDVRKLQATLEPVPLDVLYHVTVIYSAIGWNSSGDETKKAADESIYSKTCLRGKCR